MGDLQKKTLVFEEVGIVSDRYNGLSCRIRTAFHNDAGDMIYLELSGIYPGNPYLCINSAFYITDDPETDDCSVNKIDALSYSSIVNTPYTLRAIKDVVNHCFGCSFEEIVIPDQLAGYRVFADSQIGAYNTSKAYNFGDDFSYNETLTKKRIIRVRELQEYFKKLFNQRYDNTSYWIEKDNLMVRLNVTDEKLAKAGYTERQFPFIV